MVSSRRNRTATRAKFQTEIVVAANTAFVLFHVERVTVRAADGALSEARGACTARDAPDRQKVTCMAAREFANAPRAFVRSDVFSGGTKWFC